MKDDACTIRDIEVNTRGVDVQGFVRVLESRVGVGDDGSAGAFRAIVLCDADPIIWRLRFEVVSIDGPPVPCLTGLAYVGRWHDRGAAVFMHPPTRAADTPCKPHQADMTLVEPERK